MPPRIPVPKHLNGTNLCFRPASKSPTPIISTAGVATFAQRKAHKDPWALAQSAQRKAANEARQKIILEQREKALGDPVRGIPTPFLTSFDDVGGAASPDVSFKPSDDVLLNHFLQPGELEESLKTSYELTMPMIEKVESRRNPAQEAMDKKAQDEGHARASAALARIVSLRNASQADKTRANTRRCIATFGRHNTDLTLRPRPPVNPKILGGKEPAQKTPRAGPDTGSSEVQIAILTAKIRVLADKLAEKGGSKDKINKRNLRVMVHKRQKHLIYLRRKERGGERYQKVIEMLGLTEGTWQGQISL